MVMVRSIRSLLLTAVVMVISAASFGQIGVSVSFGPPALPVYEQPLCPGDGYMWTPGYWAYGDDGGYYWVPGTWVLAPRVGFLWTPPWWGWGGGGFLFHAGYWGPHVGFYGGISYGFGYFGAGFEGGRWDGGHFFYNRSVSNVNITNIHNTYNTTVVNNTNISHVSYNGGESGITRQASPEEQQAEREQHIAPVAAQTQHEEAARSNPQLRASANQGRPPIAATAKPGDFHSAVPAREAGGTYRPPAEANRGAEAGRPGNGEAARPENNVPKPPNASHASELQPHSAAQPQSSGNAKQDQKYQQQQQQLADKQNQQHQKLQQQQDKEHQQLAKQNASEAQKQQVEQRHQQQTQQLEQRHTQQQQKLQTRQQPRAGGGGKR